LLKEIDRVRELMVASALETGYTSAETVRRSQELDTLIYEYQALCRETELQRKKTRILQADDPAYKETIYFIACVIPFRHMEKFSHCQ